MEGRAEANTEGDDARIARASRAIRAMSDELKADLDGAACGTNRSQPDPLRRLRDVARTAPVQALGIAFLLGVIVARR
ncbi:MULTISPECIES: hypothetical protein [unclassified Bradyrhizobium]|uniref:hypothetical protein n=1 Tax=unclassified Bradyrhizobium TaxID=2631580 RepID=UPI00247A1278|nr:MULTISPECIES: hypothetical protein [unclassified Bradyrhizobium]WGS23497.1 hypothetical protein MTX22_18860 [Bradyrhizobium sp. ISRA463]WGS30515.1 hypothetical protein MTX19_16585 [Bradyrhizobium sp. ISRA464]